MRRADVRAFSSTLAALIACGLVAPAMAQAGPLSSPAASGPRDTDPRSGDEPSAPLPDRLPPRALEQVAAYTREKSDGHGFVTARNLGWTTPYVKVALQAGYETWFPLIEATAKEWLTPEGHFALSFRNDDRSFRTWSPSDARSTATIRIGFDHGGSWSLIGKQAQGIDVRPSERTMNLDLGPVLPSPVPHFAGSDRLIVLHEFGHALGLAHEHYHAQCQADLKFDPDAGYVETFAPGTQAAPFYLPDPQGHSPGVFKSMSGAPNFWSAADIGLNYRWTDYARQTGLRMENVLRGEPRSGGAGFVQSPVIDRSSVMLYPLASYLLKSGRASLCRFLPQGPGVQLSAMDRQAFASLYPAH